MIDRFVWFCLANKDKQFLAKFISPEGEASILKGVPITLLDDVTTVLRQIGLRYRIVYRGPRLDQVDPSFTRVRDANHFSVYAK